VSLGLYPVAWSLDLLAAVGLTGTPALAALYLLSFFDIAMGLMVLCMRGAWLWGVQILVVLGYTLVVTAALPELWLHPFGPLLKNLPILAGLMLLFYLERR
jgi:DoxX-like protein